MIKQGQKEMKILTIATTRLDSLIIQIIRILNHKEEKLNSKLLTDKWKRKSCTKE